MVVFRLLRIGDRWVVVEQGSVAPGAWGAAGALSVMGSDVVSTRGRAVRLAMELNDGVPPAVLGSRAVLS